MKIILSGRGDQDRIAYAHRPGYTAGAHADYVSVIHFPRGDPPLGEYEVSDDATEREIAAATLAVACQVAQFVAANTKETHGGE